MKFNLKFTSALSALAVVLGLTAAAPTASAQPESEPNIVVIMGDDIEPCGTSVPTTAA